MGVRTDEELRRLDIKGRDFPILRGDVKLTLKNVHNGKTEVHESHNIITNALADIFGGNYGGLLNYDNFADLYKTYLGGVLLFRDPLDLTTPNDYGIPSQSVNPCVAHAGQTPLTSQLDDYTRGNPDDTGTTVLEGSTKTTFVWAPSAGNAPKINSLALTHTDVGSYGCGVASEAQKSLNPFADVSFISNRNFIYDNNASAPLAIDGNTAYGLYKVDDTTIRVFKCPINCTKYKLQGGSLLPILGSTATPYWSAITVTLGADYDFNGQDFYYYFDFEAGTLTIFAPQTEGGNVLYKDVVNLNNWADQTATHSSITVTGAALWKFRVHAPLSGYYSFTVPVRAMILDNKLYVYGYTTDVGTPNKIFSIDLATPANIQEIAVPDGYNFSPTTNFSRVNNRLAIHGGIIATDAFLINGGTVYPVNDKTIGYVRADVYANTRSISSPVFAVDDTGHTHTINSIAINKLYLATKYNLPNEIQKTASQSMTVEYTLTEV